MELLVSFITVLDELPKGYSATLLLSNMELLSAASDLTGVHLSASPCTCPGRVQTNRAGPDGLECNSEPELLSQDLMKENGNEANRTT